MVNLSVSLGSFFLGVTREFLSPSTGPRPVELLRLTDLLVPAFAPGTGIRDTEDALLEDEATDAMLDLPGLAEPGTWSWLRLILCGAWLSFDPPASLVCSQDLLMIDPFSNL